MKYKFLVSITAKLAKDGQVSTETVTFDGGFTRVSGLSSERSTVEYNDGARAIATTNGGGGRRGSMTVNSGRVKASDLTLERGILLDSEGKGVNIMSQLFTNRETSGGKYNGRTTTFDITVTLHHQESDSAMVGWSLTGCKVKAASEDDLDANDDSGVAIERIVFSVEACKPTSASSNDAAYYDYGKVRGDINA
jgi:phage tail-like protein